MNDKEVPPRIRNDGDGWSYTIDVSTSPAYLLVTMQGIAEDQLMSDGYRDMVTLAETLPGPERRFPLVILNILALARGHSSLATVWQYGALLAHRVDTLIVVHDSGRDSVLDVFLSTLIGITSKIILCPTVDEALRTYTEGSR